MSDTTIGSPEIVAAAVRQGLELPNAEVTGAKLLVGGAMHDSWAADFGADQLVVRLSPPARDDAAKSRAEFAVMKAAYERGCRSPRPIFVGENQRGQTFMLMTRMPGDTNPRQLTTSPDFAHAREALVQHLAEDVAKLHTIRPDEIDVPMRRPEPGEDPLLSSALGQIVEYDKQKLSPHPVVEFGLRYVIKNVPSLRPQTRPVHVVHGDLRTGNIMYDSNGLTAMLDWEGTHFGEAEEDLTWFCTRVWRFNRKDLAAGGVADRETWIRAYERYSGHSIDRERLRLWEVLQNVRWSVITMMQARQHMDHVMDSHEHAAIGRRGADTELEVLRLISGREVA
ncbi:MAG: phosphotransferase family protein [Dehalococcoidia bacterium]